MSELCGEKYKSFIALSVKSLRFVMFGSACISLAGCTLLSNSPVGSLDKNLEAAIDNTKDKGYPDLAKVPDVPTNLKTDADWAKLQKFLVANGRVLDADPNTLPSTAPDIAWAMRNVDKIQASPYSAIAPDEDIAAWAARMRAILK